MSPTLGIPTVDTTGDLAVTRQAFSQLGHPVAPPQTDQETATKSKRPSSVKNQMLSIFKTRPYWVLVLGMILMLVLGILIPLPLIRTVHFLETGSIAGIARSRAS